MKDYNGYREFDCGGFDPCDNYGPRFKDECDCKDDCCTRDLRRRLCRIRDTNAPVLILSNNLLSVVFGTISRVTCGTVELTSVTTLVGTLPGATVVIPLCQINDVVTGLTAIPAGFAQLSFLR